MSDQLPHALSVMSPESRAQLAEDLRRHGAAAVGLSTFAIRTRLGLGSKRALRLQQWLAHHGADADPLTGEAPAAEPEAAPSEGRTHLVFGDSHAEPDQSLERFVWAGRMVADLLKPGDLVVNLGDWRTFASLSRHATTLERSLSRVRAEDEASQRAVALWERGLGCTVAESKVKHEITEGNHDRYMQRFVEENPVFDGYFDVWRAHRESGWHVTPFLEPFRADGVAYQHFMPSPQSPRALGGKYVGQRLLETVSYVESVVVGHNHLLNIAHRGALDGRQRFGISAGCFMTESPTYAGRGAEQWFRGALLLRNVRDGAADIEIITMDTIRRRYGG